MWVPANSMQQHCYQHRCCFCVQRYNKSLRSKWFTLCFHCLGVFKRTELALNLSFLTEISRDYFFPRFGDMPGLATNKNFIIGTALPMLIYHRSGPVPEQSWTDCCGKKKNIIVLNSFAALNENCGHDFPSQRVKKPGNPDSNQSEYILFSLTNRNWWWPTFWRCVAGYVVLAAVRLIGLSEMYETESEGKSSVKWIFQSGNWEGLVGSAWAFT